MQVLFGDGWLSLLRSQVSMYAPQSDASSAPFSLTMAAPVVHQHALAKAIYYVDGAGDLKESFPDVTGRYDEEAEFWRDSQVSSGWLGAAYRAFRGIEPVAESAADVISDDGDDNPEPTKDDGDGKEVELRILEKDRKVIGKDRARSRSRKQCSSSIASRG